MAVGYHDYSRIPAETAQLAQATFKRGNKYVVLRDGLGVLYQDKAFASLFRSQGPASVPPGLVALLTVIQFMENLSDRVLMEQLPARLDWKYLLGLPLTHAGYDYSVLSEFRQRLVDGQSEQLLLEGVLQVCEAHGLLKERGRQRTDSTYVLTAVRQLNRPELVGESLRAALDEVAMLAPLWVQAMAPPEWYVRYGQRIEVYQLPKTQPALQAWLVQVGADGQRLLAAVDQPDTPLLVRQSAAVAVLRQVWQQQFIEESGHLRLRKAGELPPASEMIQSPYDPDVRYSEKRQMSWQGYKVHFTETCDADLPPLLTQVTTTPAPLSDFAALESIQADLAAHARTPAEQVIDGGYIDAQALVHSQQRYGIELVGPVSLDRSWQANANQGYDQSHFVIDWEHHQATCPNGKESRLWSEGQDTFGNPSIHVRFAAQDCRPCPVRQLCTHSPTAPRSLRLRPQADYQALHQARHRQTTPDFHQRYDQRAGIEGAFSWAVRCFGLRISRYLGQAKTHLQHQAIAAAINLERLAAFLLGREPARTRITPFARLATPLSP